MKPFHKILVACDLSKYTNKIMGYAIAVAESTGAKLVLANIINQRDVDAIEHAVHRSFLIGKEASPETFIREHRAERETALQELVTQSGKPELFLKTVVGTGVPFQELINIVEMEQADLVIMGTRGRTNLASTLFGATAEKMFRSCPVPVLSVRLHKDESQ
jgi:nucleotide-binding universal stress UspA family protein